MSTALAKRRAKDNPLSSNETIFLVAGGIVAVGLIGGALYYSKKAAAATSSTSTTTSPVTTTTSPGSLSPMDVAADATTSIVPGGNYVVIAMVAGLDVAGNAISGMTPMTQAQVMAALGLLGWSNVSLLYWGPTNTINDPNGFLDLSRIGSVKAFGERFGKTGLYVFTSTYTGAAFTAAGFTAYKIG